MSSDQNVNAFLWYINIICICHSQSHIFWVDSMDNLSQWNDHNALITSSPNCQSGACVLLSANWPYLIHNATSTIGYDNIVLKYWIKITSLVDPEDFTFIEYSIENNDKFVTMKLYDNTVGEFNETLSLPSECSNISSLRVRFRSNGTDSQDVVYIDTVSLISNIHTTTPTNNPDTMSTSNPTNIPSISPTNNPTLYPTMNAIPVSTKSSTKNPTIDPTTSPSNNPTLSSESSNMQIVANLSKIFRTTPPQMITSTIMNVTDSSVDGVSIKAILAVSIMSLLCIICIITMLVIINYLHDDLVETVKLTKGTEIITAKFTMKTENDINNVNVSAPTRDNNNNNDNTDMKIEETDTNDTIKLDKNIADTNDISNTSEEEEEKYCDDDEATSGTSTFGATNHLHSEIIELTEIAIAQNRVNGNTNAMHSMSVHIEHNI